jgi:cytochrome P450
MRSSHQSFRPPAPLPRPHALHPLDLLKTLWRNPIEAWTQAHFEQPGISTRLRFGDVVVVNDAAAVRHILSENDKNYCKDRFQKRMLAVLSNGLLTAEGTQWRCQRRLVGPLFRPASVKSMAQAMVDAIDELVVRWSARDGSVLDIAKETTDLTLNVLETTIFSGGLSVGRDDLRAAMRTFFDALGRIDPFDLLDEFIPRVSRLHARPAIRLFDQAIDAMIAARKPDPEKNEFTTTQDILTLLVRAMRNLAITLHIRKFALTCLPS